MIISFCVQRDWAGPPLRCAQNLNSISSYHCFATHTAVEVSRPLCGLAAPPSGLPVSPVPAYIRRCGTTGEQGVPYIPTDKSGGFTALLVKIAPIFDCGSCLYQQLEKSGMCSVIESKENIDERTYVFPNSGIKTMINERKTHIIDAALSRSHGQERE